MSEKLQQDLVILTAMVKEMAQYLDSDILFWRMSQGQSPQLTLGGYLLRQRRLLALPALLSAAEQEELRRAANQFNQIAAERVVRLEQKAHREVYSRIRQWSEHVREFKERSAIDYYAAAVEVRAMISALVERLQQPPYELEPAVLDQIKLLDQELAGRWQSGEFVWPEAWQTAYPREAYWWLYGRPRPERR